MRRLSGQYCSPWQTAGRTHGDILVAPGDQRFYSASPVETNSKSVVGHLREETETQRCIYCTLGRKRSRKKLLIRCRGGTKCIARLNWCHHVEFGDDEHIGSKCACRSVAHRHALSTPCQFRLGPTPSLCQR